MKPTPCPLCGGAVTYRGLTSIACAGVGCPNEDTQRATADTDPGEVSDLDWVKTNMPWVYMAIESNTATSGDQKRTALKRARNTFAGWYRSGYLVVGALMALLLPVPASAQFGTNTVLLSEATVTKAQVDKTLALVAAGRYTWVRDYVLGPTAAKLDGARIGWWVDAIAANHLTPLVRIDYNRADAAGFAAWAVAVVQRFPSVRYFEVGNEPDGPVGARAADYYAKLAAVSAAVRAVRPDIELWGGVITSPGQFFPATNPSCVDYGPDERELGWGSALLDLGATSLVDRVSVHMYWQSALPEGPVPGCSLEMRQATLPAEMEQVADLIGLGQIPITESGHARAWTPGPNAERSQARRETRMELDALTYGWVPRFSYTFIHHAPDDTQQEASFDVLKDLDHPRPAFYASQRLHQLLNGATPVPNPPTLPGVDYHRVYRMADGRTAHALWNATADTTTPWGLGGWVVDLVGRTTLAAGSTVAVGPGAVLVITP